MKKTTFNLSVAILATGFVTNNAHASLIDFETIPGIGVPTEGLAIGTQYAATAGVSFALEDGSLPLIAEVGSPTTAFQPSDNPAAQDAALIGQFFLTDDGTVAGLNPSPLIVSYSTPTASASGVVLDIDFNEMFTIEARDFNGAILETLIIQAGDPNTGSRRATPWAIQRAQNDIFSIRFVGTRTTAGGFGLGFDNFDTGVVIPIPATVWLFGSGLLGLIGIARCKKAA